MRKIISLLTVLTLTPTIATTVNACEKNQSSLFDFFNALKGQKFNSSIKIDSNSEELEKILSMNLVSFFLKYMATHPDSESATMINFYKEEIKKFFDTAQIWNLETNTVVTNVEELGPKLKKEGTLNLKMIFFIPGFSEIEVTYNIKVENKDKNQLKNLIDNFDYSYLWLIVAMTKFKDIYHGMKVEDFNDIFIAIIDNHILENVAFTFITEEQLTDLALKNNGHAISDADLKNPGTLSLTFTYNCKLSETDSFTGESKIPLKWNLI